MGMLTRRRVLAAQSSYYLGTGLWPLLDRRSFEAVTGPKTDFWLVETVGAMVAAIGAGLALAARRDRLPDELRVTAITAAAGLGLVDLVNVARGRIRPVYLADAAVEGLLVAVLLADGRDAAPAGPEK